MSVSTNSNAAQAANNGITTADLSEERSALRAISVFVLVFSSSNSVGFSRHFLGSNEQHVLAIS